MEWLIDRILHFELEVQRWKDGYAHYGVYDQYGNLYAIDHPRGIFGLLDEDNLFEWSVGGVQPSNTKHHIQFGWGAINNVCLCKNNTYIVCSENGPSLYRITPSQNEIKEIADMCEFGYKKYVGCCCDKNNNIWVYGVQDGFKLTQMSIDGEYIKTVGTGEPGFQREPVYETKAQFRCIYNIVCGRTGMLYILDSTNYSVRMYNPKNGMVSTILGDGTPGYCGDGGKTFEARLGSSHRPINGYDGPWYMVIDEKDNLYIADTQNFVVRYIDSKTGIVSTIAGKHEVHRGKLVDSKTKDPLSLNMPYICYMEYYKSKLYISDWRGDLVVIRKCM